VNARRQFASSRPCLDENVEGLKRLSHLELVSTSLDPLATEILEFSPPVVREEFDLPGRQLCISDCRPCGPLRRRGGREKEEKGKDEER